MPFLIETWDKPNTTQLRQDNRPAHLDFLRENASKLLACGAKLDDEGANASGSIYIVDVETREEAEAFLEQTPSSQIGLPERLNILRGRKAVLDGKAFV